MKRFILITIMFLFAWNNISNAQNGIKIVEAFANDMQMWIKTDDISYREKLEEICVGGFCVDDELSRLIIKERHLNSSDLMISSYLNKVQSHIANIKISYSNFEAVTNSAELARMNSKHEVEFIACDVLIEGTINLSMKEIFTVRNGKITWIFSINQKDYKEWKKVK